MDLVLQDVVDAVDAEIYQHSSDERQRKLADAIGEAARATLLKIATVSGTHVAREASGQS